MDKRITTITIQYDDGTKEEIYNNTPTFKLTNVCSKCGLTKDILKYGQCSGYQCPFRSASSS